CRRGTAVRRPCSPGVSRAWLGRAAGRCEEAVACAPDAARARDPGDRRAARPPPDCRRAGALRGAPAADPTVERLPRTCRRVARSSEVALIEAGHDRAEL